MPTPTSAITAAVVGVILNLAVWFATHVLFDTVVDRAWGPVRVGVPEWSSLQPAALVLTVLAVVGIFVLRWGMVRVLALSAVVGMLWYLVAGVT